MSEPKSKSIKASPQHSPLPWKISLSGWIVGGLDGAIAEMYISPNTTPEERIANRSFIVRAVNLHETARKMATCILELQKRSFKTCSVEVIDIAADAARKFQEMDRD